MFSADKYAVLYEISLRAMRAHRLAKDFITRANAREVLDEAQTKLARMHKSKSFCVETAMQIATSLKAQYAAQ